ncbi:hypothetical protein [Streptomyces sp. 900105755]
MKSVDTTAAGGARPSACSPPAPRLDRALGAIADLGFVGLDDSGSDADPAVNTGYKAARHRPLTRGQKLSNKAMAAVQAPVEHGFAHLRN